jgi:ABC-2 type transport system ATP-binding protein
VASGELPDGVPRARIPVHERTPDGIQATSDDIRASEGMIEATNLSKRYGDVVAVDDVSFKIERGEVVGFLGPNGAGKTTTMRMLTGFLPPSDGTAAILGHDIFEEPLEARRAVGYLPETPPLYPEMTVSSYVDYVARIHDVPRSARKARVDRALERCGLGEVSRRVIGTLSKGFRQRVGLAQAIVHDPPVLILDEPTVGLDPLQIVEIRGLIAGLAGGDGDARHTVILSTHILPEVEAICRRVVMINEGRKTIDAPLAELTAGGKRLEELFAQQAATDAAATLAAEADAAGEGTA